MGFVEGSGSASERAVHRAGGAVTEYLAEVGGAGRRADLGVYFWRPESACGTTGLRIVRLAARRVCWGDDGVGNDGGGDGRRGNYAARPDGDAAFLRIQHGGLFPPLAGDGEENPEAAENFPCELVPEGRGWEVSVAGIRGERARAEVDSGARGRPRRGAGDTHRLCSGEEWTDAGWFENFR